MRSLISFMFRGLLENKASIGPRLCRRLLNIPLTNAVRENVFKWINRCCACSLKGKISIFGIEKGGSSPFGHLWENTL